MLVLGDCLAHCSTTRITGLAVPNVRYHALRSMFYNLIVKLCECCHHAKRFPSDVVMTELHSCVQRFFSSTSERSCKETLDDFENLVVKTLGELGIDGNAIVRNQQKFMLPEF
uniref:Vacuolar protein sorting-associated protein 51 homolog n=1 Tax=Angiostrongylus cantonensis TaxID=6313 RepID=A0A0K0D9R0_ANGCA